MGLSQFYLCRLEKVATNRTNVRRPCEIHTCETRRDEPPPTVVYSVERWSRAITERYWWIHSSPECAKRHRVTTRSGWVSPSPSCRSQHPVDIASCLLLCVCGWGMQERKLEPNRTEFIGFLYHEPSAGILRNCAHREMDAVVQA